ncbi:MAG: FAD-binding protein, partial [Raoultibacter sp.]
YAADPHLIYLIAEQGGKCIDWMADCGVRWRLGEVPVYVAPKNSTLDHHVLKMKDATDAMFNYGQKNGARYRFQCPASALVQDESGRIVGLVCEDERAGEIFIHATKAVILTAGGFCNNKALLKEYIPTAAMGCASSYLVGGEGGECFRMGLGVQADVSGFNSSASFDGGVDWEAEGGTWARFLYDGMTQLSRQPWFTIDRCGNRLRYMDSRVKKDGADAIYALGDLATIQMTPPGHRSYIIFDARYEEYLAGFGQEHCRKLITPDLEQIDKVPAHYRDWHHGVQDALDADVLKKRDSLESLEQDLG